MGVVIDPDLVTKERLTLDVETQEGHHYGLLSERTGNPKMDVCLEVNADKFLELFVSRLSKK